MDDNQNENGNTGRLEKTAYILGLISSVGTFISFLVIALLFLQGWFIDSGLFLIAICIGPVLGILFLIAIIGLVLGIKASKTESPSSKKTRRAILLNSLALFPPLLFACFLVGVAKGV